MTLGPDLRVTIGSRAGASMGWESSPFAITIERPTTAESADGDLEASAMDWGLFSDSTPGTLQLTSSKGFASGSTSFASSQALSRHKRSRSSNAPVPRSH